MDLSEWDAIWWYRYMRYPGIPCIDGLATGPLGFGASQTTMKHPICFFTFRYNDFQNLKPLNLPEPQGQG